MEIDKLVEMVNILDSHSMILFTIEGSKSMSIEMERIVKLINPNCTSMLDEKCNELYELANSMRRDQLDSVIRAVNPGFIRMNLRTIYKNRFDS